MTGASRGPLRELAGELLASATLVVIVFASGAARVQLGAGTAYGAIVGSLALGLGYALVLRTFGPLSGAQANPLLSIIASALGDQAWSSTARRIVAQVVGAGLAALAVQAVAPYTFAHDPSYVAVNPVAEAVATFGFVVIALGIAHRRDAKVPLGLGAFAVASFWMTGHGTLGNPLLSIAVAWVAIGDHVGAGDIARLAASTAIGATVAAIVGGFVFPHVREAATALVFSPRIRE